MSGNRDDVLRIGHLVFWGGEGSDGFFIDAEGFEGWSDAPNTRTQEVNLDDGDGSYDSTEFYEARIITVSGLCIAGNAERLEHWRNQLFTVLQGRKQIFGNYQGARQFVFGRRFGQPKFQTIVPGSLARFQFQIRCANPRKYGERVPTTVTGANQSQSIYHRGNFNAYPTLIVRGTMPSYRIEGPNSTWQIARAVTPSTPHTIDNFSGVLYENGQVPLSSITSGVGWSFPPGRIFETHRLIPDSGSGTLETVLYDTFI